MKPVRDTNSEPELPLMTLEYYRQYSYSLTVLGRVGLERECEANAGNFSLIRQTNMGKLRLSCRKSRKMFNVGKFRRAYKLKESLF